MRTSTIPEKVFDSSQEASKYVENVNRLLQDKVALCQVLEQGIDLLFGAIAIELDAIPLYHNLELSVGENLIKVYLQTSVRWPDGLCKYQASETVMLYWIGEFLTEVDNGYLSYNPAEGF